MRLSNYKNVEGNKASIVITGTLYDRRALDCTSDKPLVNSLNNLTFLASSSAKVRDTLVTDCGLLRLIDILSECTLDSQEDDDGASIGVDHDDAYDQDFVKNLKEVIEEEAPDSPGLLSDFNSFIECMEKGKMKRRFRNKIESSKKKVLVSWKWTLTLQVLVLCGTRGNETIRQKIVQSGIIQIIATVLDNYLLVKSGAIVINKAGGAGNNGKQDGISKLSDDLLRKAYIEAAISMHGIVSELNQNPSSNVPALPSRPNTDEDSFIVEKIRRQVNIFVSTTSSKISQSPLTQQQLRTLSRLLLETMKSLNKASVNGLLNQVRNNESNFQLLRNIKSNLQIIKSFTRGINNSVANQSLEISPARISELISTTNALNSEPGSRSWNQPEGDNSNGLRIFNGASASDTASGNSTSTSTGEAPNLQVPRSRGNPTFDLDNDISLASLAYTQNIIKCFCLRFIEIASDQDSNDQHFVNVRDILITDSQQNVKYWSVACRGEEVSLSIDISGKLSIVCSCDSESMSAVVSDILIICKHFANSIQPLNAGTSNGLDSFKGVYTIRRNHRSNDGNIPFKTNPHYYIILAHLFKNVFFRDLNGCFLVPQCVIDYIRDGAAGEPRIDVPRADTGASTAVTFPVNDDSLSSTYQYVDMFFNAPRQFFKGKIVPTDDDIVWVLQLLAFVSKYTYMKDYLQYTYILPKLSLRDYPNDINNKGEPSELDKELNELNKQIVENHFKMGWNKIGCEFFMFKENLSPDIRLPMFLSEPSNVFDCNSPPMDIYLSLWKNMHDVMKKIKEPADGAVTNAQKAELIEDKLFSLKINGELEKFKESFKLLEKTNKEDVAELFLLISKYKSMASMADSKIDQKTQLQYQESTDISEELSGDEMESVELGRLQSTNSKYKEMLCEVQGLPRRETEKLKGQDSEYSSTEVGLPLIREKSKISSAAVEKQLSSRSQAHFMKCRMDKAMLKYEIMKKFEKITKVNAKLTGRLKKMKDHEDRVAKLKAKWTYDDYDFDDYDYQSLIKNESAADNNNSQVAVDCFEDFRDKFIHLPVSYCKSPVLTLLVDNYNTELPSISHTNFFPVGKDQEQFKKSMTTVILKHDLDYSVIPLDYLNIFGLVEQFSAETYSNDITHLTGVIMRNSCRKDEQREGIRQCANTRCGKWETDRKFSKCRRCRRAKYCSRECQLASWEHHKYWCQPASESSTSSTSSKHHHHRRSRNPDADATMTDANDVPNNTIPADHRT